MSETVIKRNTPSPNNSQDCTSGNTPNETQVITPEIIEKILKDNPHVLASFQAKHHKGPLPSPQTFAGYENVVSGAANRILIMAEQQLAHGIDMDCQQMQLNIDIAKRASFSSRLGTIFGFIICLILLLGSFLLLWSGKTPEGLITIFLTTGGLITAFITGQKSKKNYLKLDSPPTEKE